MNHRLNTGILIAFEGIDGAGKTTQANRLVDFLRDSGFEVVFTKEPTTGPWGQKIRTSAQTGRMSPDEELSAFLMDRREHVRDLIEPSLAAGKIVVIDRYYFSTVAYQGARGMSVDELLAKNEAFAPEPDMLILLDIDAEKGLDRVNTRGKADLFENVEALTASRAIFNGITKPYTLRLDATRAMDDLEGAIRGVLYCGPLQARMCPEVRADGGSCSHYARSFGCDWSRLDGFERVPAGVKARIEALIDDSSLSDDQKLQQIISATQVQPSSVS